MQEISKVIVGSERRHFYYGLRLMNPRLKNLQMVFFSFRINYFLNHKSSYFHVAPSLSNTIIFLPPIP
jgi:hypothetical protein